MLQQEGMKALLSSDLKDGVADSGVQIDFREVAI